MEKLLTVNEIAELLDLSKFAIYNMVNEKSIPCIKFGLTNRNIRFDRIKIEEWLNKNSHDIIKKKK